MIAALQEFGAGLIYYLILFCAFFACVWLVAKGLNRFMPDATETKTLAIGCPLIVLLLVLIGLILAPALQALQSLSCRGAADFDLCMNPPDPEWM